MSSSKAIFLGKFQPPHLGHVRTILRLKDRYPNLTIGITEDTRIMPPEEVKKIFDEVFRDFDSISTTIVKGVVEKGTATLPEGIEIVFSGNEKVLDYFKEEYETVYVPRTEGLGYSGTEIREAIGLKKPLPLQKKYRFEKKVVEIETLKPLERVLPTHLLNIAKMIGRDGEVRKPLIVDRRNGIVLDGSHRYAYLMQEGYRLAPVVLVDYEDEAIFVGNHLKHRFVKDNDFRISKKEVVRRALSGDLFPPRTTRHFFPFRKEDWPVALEKLERGAPRSIDSLIEKCSLQTELELDRRYIEEIDEEIEIIREYLNEEKETREYLLRQLRMMEQ